MATAGYLIEYNILIPEQKSIAVTKDSSGVSKDSSEVTTLLTTLVEQQKQVITMLSTLLTQTHPTFTTAASTSTTVLTSTIVSQAEEKLPTSSGLQQACVPSNRHQLPGTCIPTLTDNFFLEDLTEGEKTDITDDDLALLSSPSLITYSDQSFSQYESDTLPSTSMHLPSSASQLQPPQYLPSYCIPQFPPPVPAQLPTQFPPRVPAQILAQLPP